jgi:hypothetical protein
VRPQNHEQDDGVASEPVIHRAQVGPDVNDPGWLSLEDNGVDQAKFSAFKGIAVVLTVPECRQIDRRNIRLARVTREQPAFRGIDACIDDMRRCSQRGQCALG